MGQFYIICYDTPSNRRRRKLHKTLKNYAVAVQKSVFETILDGPRFDELLNRIMPLIDPAVDSVRIYSMTREGQRQMKVFGFPGLLEDPDHFFLGNPSGQKDSQPLEELDVSEEMSGDVD